MSTLQPKEEDVFNVARQIADSESRRVYVEETCGNDLALRSRVFVLLQVHEEERSFLERLAKEPGSTVEKPIAEGPGTQIGPYKLIEKIGEGGFGVVFMAEQQQPIRRRVALKVLKPGMDSGQVVARFEAERQALALMEHPNIAHVLDGGQTATGRPYFVMELVKGIPITKYCDEQKLSPRERLALFIPICEAVQHAHQKGIIHRDLKPGNVLIASYDGKPSPKVIDFGVAKAMGQQLTERTLVTSFGGIVGTLEYMSPEQAEFNALDIDTRADIYCLGVMLYELLTGSTPLTKQRLKEAAITEVLRLIREEEPPTPSTRLGDSRESLASISAQRRLEPARLTKEVRGELDWIVMKCLEKDRSRRYETANGLARDIQRYLTEEAVEAGPPSARYKLRKFAHKHRKLLVVAAAFALLLAIGTAFSTWQAVRATIAERAAAEERDKVLREKERADEEAAISVAVNEFLRNDLLGQSDVHNQPTGVAREKDITARELLDCAAEKVSGKFAGQPRSEAAIRHTLGSAYEGLGLYPEAQQHFERSLELHKQSLGSDHPNVLECTNGLAMLLRSRGRSKEALPLFELVLDRRRASLGNAHLLTLTSLNNLGGVYLDLGRFDDAESVHREAVEGCRRTLGDLHRITLLSLNGLSVSYLYLGRVRDAEPLLREVVDGVENTLGKDHPFTLSCKRNLAGCYMDLRRYDEAEPLYRHALEIDRANLGEDHPNTLFSMNFVGLVLEARGRYEEAETVLTKVLELRRAKLSADHPDVLTSMGNLALVFKRLKKYVDAEALISKALEGRRTKLGDDHPDTLRSMNNLGELYVEMGRNVNAQPLFRDAAEGAKKRLGINHTQTQLYMKNLAALERPEPEQKQPD